MPPAADAADATALASMLPAAATDASKELPAFDADVSSDAPALIADSSKPAPLVSIAIAKAIRSSSSEICISRSSVCRLSLNAYIFTASDKIPAQVIEKSCVASRVPCTRTENTLQEALR